MCTGTNRRGPAARASAVVWVLCAAGAGILGGCASEAKTRTTTSLGDWPGRKTPLILAGDRGADAVGAYDEMRRDLSEAQWEVLLRYAPRSTWDRIRSRKKDIDAARRAIAASKLAARKATTQPAELLDVPTTTLAGGQIRMYYRIRHYGGVKVTAAKATGLSRRTITIAAGDVTTLAALVTKHLAGKGTVSVLPGNQVLLITCTADAKASVLKLLALVDSPTPQVEITARIFEVQHDMDFQVGVKLLLKYLGSDVGATGVGASMFSAEDFAKGAGAMTAAGVNPQDPGSAMRILNVFGHSGWSTDTTIQAMAQTGLIKLVSSPRMTVTVGNTGYVLAGQEMPVQSAILSNDNVVTQQLSYKPIGVQLYVTPQIIGTESVKLHVVTVASEISGFKPLTAMGGMAQEQVSATVMNPILDTREAESYVDIPDGNALVIGGLRRVRKIVRENKIPGLGDIPYLGWLFKRHRSQTQITDLYFFVTPRIIRQ